MTIDLNCDLGEGFPNDHQIIPYISSANIACGFHAGSDTMIKKTIEDCLKNDVAVGAHPGYADKENFGRTEQQLSSEEYYELISEQFYVFKKITDTLGIKIHHIKPHGALYNQAAKSQQISEAIVKAIKEFDEHLILYGLSGSSLISEAKKNGLKCFSEVFADRTYQDDGSLTPRSHPYALITDDATSINQVLQMIQKGSVTSLNKVEVLIKADTICIHGDGNNAISFARLIHQTLKQKDIGIKAG